MPLREARQVRAKAKVFTVRFGLWDSNGICAVGSWQTDAALYNELVYLLLGVVGDQPGIDLRRVYGGTPIRINIDITSGGGEEEA